MKAAVTLCNGKECDDPVPNDKSSYRLTFAFPDLMEFKGEDDVIGILTELADKPFSPTEWAALDMSNCIGEHRTQVPHFHTTLDLHTRKKLMRDCIFCLEHLQIWA